MDQINESSDPKWLLEVVSKDRGQWRQYACGALQNLAVSETHRNELMEQYSAVGPLLEVVQTDDVDGKSVEYSCGAIWGLAMGEENREVLVDEGVVLPLLRVVRENTGKAAENACGALQNIALSEEAALKLTDGFDIIATMLELSQEPNREKREPLIAVLWALSIADPVKGRAVQTPNLLDVLLQFGSDGSNLKCAELAISALQNLATADNNKQTMAQHNKLIESLVTILKSDKGNEDDNNNNNNDNNNDNNDNNNNNNNNNNKLISSEEVESSKPHARRQYAAGALHHLSRSLILNNLPDNGNEYLEAVMLAFENTKQPTPATAPAAPKKLREHSMGCIFGLAFVKANREILLSRDDVVRLCVAVVVDAELPKLLEYGLGALWGLSVPTAGRIALIENHNLATVTKTALVDSSLSGKAKENACYVLQNLTGFNQLIDHQEAFNAVVVALKHVIREQNTKLAEMGCSGINQLAGVPEAKATLVKEHSIVDLLVQFALPHESLKAKQKGCSAILSLAIDSECHENLIQPNVLDAFANILAGDALKSRKYVATTALHLSDGEPSKEAMVNHTKFMEVTKNILTNKSEDERVREQMCGVVCGLAFAENNRRTLVEQHDMIEIVRNLLETATGQERCYGCGILWGLSYDEKNKEVMVVSRSSAIIEWLSSVVAEGSGKETEYCCQALQNISIPPDWREELFSRGVGTAAKTATTKHLQQNKPTKTLTSACSILQNMSISKPLRIGLVTELGVVSVLVAVVQRSREAVGNKAREIACATLKNLSLCQENRELLADEPELISTMLGLVRNENASDRLQKLASGVLKNLLLDDETVNDLAALFGITPSSETQPTERARPVSERQQLTTERNNNNNNNHNNDNNQPTTTRSSRGPSLQVPTSNNNNNSAAVSDDDVPEFGNGSNSARKEVEQEIKQKQKKVSPNRLFKGIGKGLKGARKSVSKRFSSTRE